MAERKVERAVNLFLQAGYNVSPEIAKLLYESDEPESFAKEVLATIERMKEKPPVLLPQHLKLLQDSLWQFSSSQGGTKEDWDFADANTQFLTHGLHPYPARMVPQIAERLIRRYLIEKFSPPHNRYAVMDPFCGSGTVLVEARRLGVSSVGVDINPLAVLLARVKSMPPDPQELEFQSTLLLDRITKMGSETETHEGKMPNYIRFWFAPETIKVLQWIKCQIDKIEDEGIQDFMKLCFSNAAFKLSFADISNHQAHPAKLPIEKIEKRKKLDVTSVFTQVLKKSLESVKEYHSLVNKDVKAKVIWGDARELPFSEEFDLVVTSPPYGEEHNTVGYMRWAKISLFWLGYTPYRLKHAEKKTLGGSPRYLLKVPSETCNEVINHVRTKKPERALLASCFFNDYYESLVKVSKALKSDRYCCIIIGNRLLLGRKVPIDKITIELAEPIGLEYETTYYRNIPKKVMPYRVPEGETINKESILILKK